MLIKSKPIRRCWPLLMLLIVAAGCDAASNRTVSPFVLAPSEVAYTLSGVISEPGAGAVAGATVQGRGNSATTDSAGRFTIGELAGSQELVLSKFGYEPRTVSVGQTDRDRLLNSRWRRLSGLQPAKRLTSPSTRTTQTTTSLTTRPDRVLPRAS